MSHPWTPASPCGTGCLTAGEPASGPLRRGVRYLAVTAVLLGTVTVAPLLALAGSRVRAYVLRLVSAGVLRALGVRLRVHGRAGLRATGRGALVVSNHVSWLDIVALNAVRPMRALAKKEVADWPVLGGLAVRGGTILLDRERLSALPGTVAALASALRDGAQVSVNPEGTTWCGLASGRFAPAVFQAAIDGGVPVRPVALRFLDGRGRETTRPAFIGTETLVDSVRRVAGLRGLVLELRVCPEIAPGRADGRRELAALAEDSVRSALGTTGIPVRTRRRTARPAALTVRRAQPSS
ncbi:1-acyl-sn-glycerol-3-phosphate acyltransferase [Amycolatopsis antarctica]|uniref:1-acyl-sn-glycerol-3-phosphate acyltransferase n=1 Tax=Amycolatopsis antarctica TaxID=1854586 RepID=A0A263D6N8_9PSEU|nr:lysophospholipid acyltransferase family protein [Amycolatopsis antarctica]OZM74031.1 1-acyl-sn-glycerol-3-phosphate acyltransferase [Amycolatopsis antarctica]